VDPLRAQEILFVHSVAAYRAHCALAGRRSGDVFAGLSLGEYAAMVCSGALDFERGLRLVRTRARLMSEATEDCLQPSGMLVVQAVTREEVLSVLVDTVFVANQLNAHHFILSGLQSGLDEVEAHLPPHAQATRLPMKSAFHSPYMRMAAEKFRSVLAAERAHIRSPLGDLLINTATSYVCIPAGGPGLAILDALAEGSICVELHTYQILQDVASRRSEHGGGEAVICEYGTGCVLTNLLRSMDKAIAAAAIALE
jgi:malonyl CoA-acyl carrier protein transacylase